MSATEYPVVTISGSMRFLDRMFKEASRLTAEGWIVLMPFVAYIYIKPGEQENNPVKEMLDDMHFTKISMSELVFVVNVGGYIGQSTKNEIDYALEHGVEVQFLEP